MTYSQIDYAITGKVAFVRLNDPETLNSLSTQLLTELREAVERAQGEARAILIGSIGRAFSSGANLTGADFSFDDPERDLGAQLETYYNPLILAMRRSAIPIVTAVRGPAAGAGCSIALAGDLIVAGESAYFFQAFGKIGLVPDAGSSYLLSRAIGRARAMEMMLLGERVPAVQALEWGMINRLVPDDQLDAVALDLATRLAEGPRAIGLIREVAWAAFDSTLDEALATERDYQRRAGRTDDFAEGVTAFLQKRPPVFSGR